MRGRLVKKYLPGAAPARACPGSRTGGLPARTPTTRYGRAPTTCARAARRTHGYLDDQVARLSLVARGIGLEVETEEQVRYRATWREGTQ